MWGLQLPAMLSHIAVGLVGVAATLAIGGTGRWWSRNTAPSPVTAEQNELIREQTRSQQQMFERLNHAAHFAGLSLWDWDLKTGEIQADSVTKAALGKIVTTTTGSWPVGGLALSYQWQVKAGSDWVDIVDATHEYLSLNGSLEPFVAGNSIRVVVTATRSGYLPSTATSAPVLITG